MKIICPNCNTAYKVSLQALGSGGRKVRCARCRTEWHAEPQDETGPPASGAGPDWNGEDESFDFADEVAETSGHFAAAEDRQPSSRHPATGTATGTEGPTIDADTAIADRSATNVEAAAQRRRPGAGMRRPGKGGSARRLPAPLAIAAGLVLIISAIMFRNSVVAWVPDLAGLYRLVGLETNIRGLEFTAIKTSRKYENGVPLLVIEGEIVNVSGKRVDIPAMRFALRNADDREIYSWTRKAETPVLEAGQRTRFRSTISGLPDGGRSVQLRFIDRDLRQARL